MTTEADLQKAARPTQPIGPRIFRWFIGFAIVIPAIWGAVGLNVSLDRLLSAPGDIWNVVSKIGQPELSPEAIQRVMPKVMESFFIAWIGTIIGAFFSFPLAFLAAKNISSGVTQNVVRQLRRLCTGVPKSCPGREEPFPRRV